MSGRQQPPMFVGGDSAGGGSVLSFVLTMLANQSKQRQLAGQSEHLAPIAGVFTYSPVTNLLADSPTYYLNNFGSSASAYTGDILYQRPLPAHSNANLEMAVSSILDKIHCSSSGQNSVRCSSSGQNSVRCSSSGCRISQHTLQHTSHIAVKREQDINVTAGRLSNLIDLYPGKLRCQQHSIIIRPSCVAATCRCVAIRQRSAVIHGCEWH